MYIFLILAVTLHITGAAIPPVDEYRLKHLGCWKDSKDYRAVPLLASNLGEDCLGWCGLDGCFKKACGAIEACKNLAIEKGFTVFGVQSGGMCYSSATAEETYQMHGGVEGYCNADGTGAPVSSEVYKIVQAGSEEDTVLQTVGCWADDADEPAIASVEGDYDYPVLNGAFNKRNFAVEKCKVVTEGLGFSMFGVQAGGKCVTSPLAAKHFRKYGESDGCKEDGEGGNLANHIYTVVHNNYTVNDLGCWKAGKWTGPSNGLIFEVLIPRLDFQESLLLPMLTDQGYVLMPFEYCKQAALKRGYSVFALSNRGTCFSSADAEHRYRELGEGSTCGAEGLGGPEDSQVYEIDPCSCSSTLDDRDWELERVDYDLDAGKIDEDPVRPDAVSRITVDNRENSMDATNSLEVDETVTESSNFQHTGGANLMLGMGIEVGIPLFTKTEFSGEISGNYQYSWGEESSTEYSITATYPCKAAPGVILECSAFLWFYDMDVPYTMTWVHRKKDCPCKSYGAFTQSAGTEVRTVNKEIDDPNMVLADIVH